MNIDYIARTFSKYLENQLVGPPYPRCSDSNALPDAYKPLGKRVLDHVDNMLVNIFYQKTGESGGFFQENP